MSVPGELLRLQVAFQDHLLGGSGAIAGAVKTRSGQDAAARLAIYHHAYRARLVEAVREGHEHTARWLGIEAFEELALEFVERHPSRHPNLRWYARGFAAWLPARQPQDPALSELATLDWALRCAFDGPDAAVLGLAEFAGISPGRWGHIGFALHPTASRRTFRCNTLAIWHAIDEERAAPPVQWQRDPVEVLVWRRDLQPHFRSLQPFEAAALDLIAADCGLDATCEELASRFPGIDVTREAGALLRRWIDEGLLSSITGG